MAKFDPMIDPRSAIILFALNLVSPKLFTFVFALPFVSISVGLGAWGFLAIFIPSIFASLFGLKITLIASFLYFLIIFLKK